MDFPQLTCPNCQKTGPLRPEMHGRSVRCPQCGTSFAVPMPAPLVLPAIETKPFSLRDQLNDPVLWRFLCGAVPVGARATLVGAVAGFAAWIDSLPPSWLLGGAAFWLWQRRGRIDFTGLLGSARFETLPALGRAGMIGRDGLLLGRFQEADFRRSRALLRLLTRPWTESDAVCRHFLTALTGRRLDFSAKATGPLLCVPRGDYCHLATIAPTGGGKGVNTVIPNLLNYPNSVLVVDLKGENYVKTAAYRSKSLGQTIVVLDPCGVTGAATATLNALDLIDRRSPTVIEDIRSLAEALIVKTAQDHDPYWNEQAVSMLTAVMLLVVCQGSSEERNLNEVRRILSSRIALDAALAVMIESDDLGGMLARLGNQILAIPEREQGSILASVNRHTNFLDSELVATSVAFTSFNIRSIAKRPTSVYLVLPPQYLGSLSRLMRLWISSLLLVVEQAGANEEHEVLFILDEVAQLGEMRPIEKAITLLRGYGIRCWLILQSISQLESCYSAPRAKTILANCQTIQLFGISDYETAEYISKHMGDMTIASPNRQEGTSTTSGSGPNSSSNGRNRGWSFGATGRKLLQPEEILRRPDSVFVLQAGRNPILGRKIAYYADPEFDAASRVEDKAARRPVSRVSVLLCLLGLVAGLKWLDDSYSLRSLAVSAWPQAEERLQPNAQTIIRIECPHCGKSGSVPASYGDRRPLRCTTCRRLMSFTHPH